MTAAAKLPLPRGGDQVDGRCLLDRALDYENRDVVDKFVDHFGVADQEARSIFRETLKWLWLNAVNDGPPLTITPELLILDEMWHTFVLFTRDYTDYCESRFGRYLHHQPTTRREHEQDAIERARDPEGFDRRRKEARRRQYSRIAERLGQDTLVCWYADYPLRYGHAFFAPFAIEAAPLDPEVEARMRALVARDRRCGET